MNKKADPNLENADPQAHRDRRGRLKPRRMQADVAPGSSEQETNRGQAPAAKE